MNQTMLKLTLKNTREGEPLTFTVPSQQEMEKPLGDLEDYGYTCKFRSNREELGYVLGGTVTEREIRTTRPGRIIRENLTKPILALSLCGYLNLIIADSEKEDRWSFYFPIPGWMDPDRLGPSLGRRVRDMIRKHRKQQREAGSK